MAAFQETRAQTEQEVMLNLLKEIEANPRITQRSLAQELGIALGLMNAYLKRSIKKGWIRANQISPKRISYFLTPEGFSEKSQMVRDYLSRSMTFFRDAKDQCEQMFSFCEEKGWSRIALVGDGDLSEIAHLVANGSEIKIEVVSLEGPLNKYDAVMITDILDPQGTYDAVIKRIDESRVLTLELLHISRKKPKT